MALTADDVLGLWLQRRSQAAPIWNRMRLIRDTYNGDVVVPLPEMDRNDAPSVANLLTQGIDQTAGRVASQMPVVQWLSTKPGDRAADRKAETATKAARSWWADNRMGQKLRYRARHLIAYSASPASINPGKDHPQWEVFNPLTTWPAPPAMMDEIVPADVIYESVKPRAWLAANFPDALQKLRDKEHNRRPDDPFTILRYCGPDQIILVACAATLHRHDVQLPWDQVIGYQSSGAKAVVLAAVDNRVGCTLATYPRRVVLDRQQGQFDQMLGPYNLQSRLMALEVIAIERGIFPDTYLISRPGEVGRFIDGPHDGRSGEVNIVSGADLQTVTQNPGYQTTSITDRLERAQRLSAGIPAEFGGESTSNIRTGRRGDAVLSAVVDFPVMEAQELLAATLQIENELAAEVEKAWGPRARMIAVGRGNKAKAMTYEPQRVFDSTLNQVTYPAVGTDLNGLVISMAQRVGSGMMSKVTGMTLDPMIEDPEWEQDQIVAEGLEAAMLAGLQQQAQSGQIPPADLARIVALVTSDKMELADAVQKVQAEAQQRQATQAPPGAPETMPGLAQPGMGAEQPPAAIAGPSAGQQNLSDLFSSLRRPQMMTGPERALTP